MPIAGLAVAFALLLHPFLVTPQQTSQPVPPLPAASATQSPPGTPQQPGEGAQVHTGTSSGLDTDARLLNLLADHQYLRVQAQIGQLPPAEAQFYRGILANRSNDLKTSVELLAPLVDQVTASGNVAHEKLLRMALAEDYLRLGDWAKAAQSYQTLDTRLHANLRSDELDEIEMPLKMLPLAKDDPPMTVDPCEPFRLQVSDDPLRLIDIPVFVDASPHTWMLDPTEPFNLISRSTARAVGLQISAEAATIRTLTGRPIQVHVTVIPRFTIGGRLTLRNMTAFVFDDADYYFKNSGYQVEGVLGYPALAAMGSLTVSDNAIEVRPSKEIETDIDHDHLTTGAPFYLDGDEIIVALGNESDPATGGSPQSAAAGGHDLGESNERMFAIDAGSQQTYLTSRWFDENAAQFNSQKTIMFSFPGEDSPPQPAYVAESVPLVIGKTGISLHYISVLTQPLGSAAHDDVYGLLGIDALDQLKSYTFDYRTMRFSVRGD
ncbi:MAG: retropepsin-like aspartic protease [Terracidiphilus sp.]